MTPTSTDRPHAVSPLDIFGAISPPSAAGGEPSQAFEALLNKGTSGEKFTVQGHPQQQRLAEHPEPEADTQPEYTPKVSRTPAGKKPSAETCPTDERQRIDDDQLTEDEDAADATSGSAAGAAQTPPPQEEAKVAQSHQEDVRTRPEDPASDEKSIDISTALVPETIEVQLPGAAPPFSESTDSSQLDSPVMSIAGSVNTVGPGKPAPPVAEPEAAGDGALSPREYAAAVHGNGPLSLAEPAQNNSNAADSIVAIDEQTAASTVEIQPAEPGSSSDKGSDSNPHEESPQTVGETSGVEIANPSTLKNQEATSAAAPPPATGDAPSAAKEASQPQSSTSQPTGGTPPAAHRLYQNLLGRTEGNRGHSPAPVPVEARFLNRVAKAFLSAQQRDGEVRLRLSPPELGSLRLQVSVQDGVMVARMETETEAAKAQLTNNLPALRERLAEQGIRIERFDIDLMQHASTGTPDRPSDPEQRPDPQPFRTLRTNQSSTEIPSPAASSGNWNGQGRLNVII